MTHSILLMKSCDFGGSLQLGKEQSCRAQERTSFGICLLFVDR